MWETDDVLNITYDEATCPKCDGSLKMQIVCTKCHEDLQVENAELRQRAEKAEAEIERMKPDYDHFAQRALHWKEKYQQAEAECAVLRESLGQCVAFGDRANDFLPANIAAEWPIPGKRARKLLASTDAGKQAAEVLRAAVAYVNRYKDVPATESLSLWGNLKDAVDDHRSQREGGTG